MKTCRRCNEEKDNQKFSKNKKISDGLHTYCKSCMKTYKKKHWSKVKGTKNAERRAARGENSEYYQTLDKERRGKNSRKEYMRKYLREYQNDRLKTDIHHRLRCNLRARIRTAFKRGYKTGSAIGDLGCSIGQFKQHLESKFETGMNWDNYGVYWNLDHIKPLNHFNLTDREQMKQAAHYTNIQPMIASENFSKGDRFVGRVFPSC